VRSRSRSAPRPRRLRRAALAATAAALSACARIETIAHEPRTTPEQWCAARPCVRLGGVVLDQPLGTLLVFTLAALWIAAGARAWRARDGQRSRAWFAVALVLGGVAAALAGTSFQAFGYELECAGRPQCIQTNWFEVGYLIVQAASVAAMLAAVAHACATGARRRAVLAYAVASALVYAGLAAAGGFVPVAALVSFDLFVVFAAPSLLGVLAIGAVRAWHRRDALGRSLVVASLWLVATFAAYYAYAAAGVTQALWDGGAGFYFSENDVLHVGMIAWLAYAGAVVAPRLRDASGEADTSPRAEASPRPR